jgi:hypothetical protein
MGPAFPVVIVSLRQQAFSPHVRDFGKWDMERIEELDQYGFAHLWRTAQRRRGDVLAAWLLQFWRRAKAITVGAPPSPDDRVPHADRRSSTFQCFSGRLSSPSSDPVGN